MRGVDMSQMMYLAFRYNFHREALDNPEVRQLFLEEGVPFDPHVVDEWRQNIEQQKTIKEIFTPLPAEALPSTPSLIQLASKFLFQAPKTPLEAAWRLVSSTMLAVIVAGGYGLVAYPDTVKAMLGHEEKVETIDARLLRILEQRGVA
jgi:hypothetical protein